MLLLIDHYDSFIDMIADYCQQLGAQYLLVKTDQITPEIIYHNYITHIIIGPGPGHPDDLELTETKQLVASALSLNLPILGICLGHQLLASYFGANIQTAKTIAHGKVSVCTHNGGVIFKDIPQQFKITRYHSLAINPATIDPQTLLVTAISEDQEIMAVEHNSYPVYGVQFHPESIMTEHGLQLLKNFLNLS
jgi:anthranilate synthase component 2